MGRAAVPICYGYTPRWYRSYTNLLFLRARYYAPETGTFLSRDAWSGSSYRPDTLHGYMYAGSNPVLYIDPAGFDWLPQFQRYTCDDPSVAGGYDPDGNPCIVSPDNVQTGNGPTNTGVTQMNLCVPTYPGDISWKYRPGCHQANSIPANSTVTSNINNLLSGLDGYVEGVVGTVILAGCQVAVKGVEVVYDFQSGERANFTYSGTAEYGVFADSVWKFDFFGETVIGPTGVDSSLFGASLVEYVGPIWGFQEGGDIQAEYEGPFWSGGVSVGPSTSPQLSTGVSVFSGVDNGGLPNFGLWGVIIPVGSGWGPLPGKYSMPLNVSVGWTKYQILGSKSRYIGANQQIDYRNMMRDVAAGVASPLSHAPTLTGTNLRELVVDAVMSR